MNKVIIIIFIVVFQPAQVLALNTKSFDDCGESENAVALAKIIINTIKQRRQKLNCSKELSLIAAQKAKEMALEEIVSHVINNTTPNEKLRKAGIILPRIYKIVGNQVESVSGGKSLAQETFDYFMTSPVHKAHLLGENEFYLKQHSIGVGHYFDNESNHSDYWVVYITAFRDEDDPEDKLFVFNYKFSYKIKKEELKRVKKKRKKSYLLSK
jgi:uncharacterized protein YkwD